LGVVVRGCNVAKGRWIFEWWLLHEGTMVIIGFLAQASVSCLGMTNRGSPKSFARVVAQATDLHFERGIVSFKQGGLA